MFHKKIAIVYDWFDTRGGGVERVLSVLHSIYPQAVFFTSYIDKDKARWSKDFKVHTSFLQTFPSFIKNNRILSLPFFPFVFESFQFRDYDTVISVTSSFAKGIITLPGTQHICYLLTPTRYLWIMPETYGLQKKSFYIRPFFHYFKQWDLVASSRPDRILSISDTVSKRCKAYYRRDSQVIYPPFDIDYWKVIKNSVNDYVPSYIFDGDKPYYLLVSRLEKYKNVDIAINAFLKLKDKRLFIVGTGRQKKALMDSVSSHSNVRFLEYVNDRDLAYLYQHAEALIMPQEEDFGYVAIEAQFFGCPVIAYKKGGAEETIQEGETGIFFDEQSVNGLLTALERFRGISYNVRASARIKGPQAVTKFDKKNFIQQFQRVVEIKDTI